MMPAGGEVWHITPAERAKHDVQFQKLSPSGGHITGNQARGFFLQSGLPPQILAHIWNLADMDGDGRMDQKEFSIAMFLIQKKLKGGQLPQALPESLKADPVVMGGPIMSTGFPSMATGGFGGTGMGSMTMSPQHPAVSSPSSVGSMGGFGLTSPPTPTAVASPNPQNIPPAPINMGEWAVPQSTKLKYTQAFNMHDRAKRGFLNGMEARAILTQTGLNHQILAQIWNLADVDNDGKLTCEEFVLALHLVDVVRTGQPLPTKLPADLLPPSKRRSSTTGAPVGIAPVANMPGMSSGGFGGGAFNPGATPAMAPGAEVDNIEAGFSSLVTFEDKRKENFDKGQAELEKRRAMLRELQRKEQEDRIAAERAEYEKREKIRLEQERKKQMELEKQLEKQRAIEQEREEHRRKALEQKEAARRELERQRQLEWGRQRREQLNSEKLREQHQTDQVQSFVTKLSQELENSDDKKNELVQKIEQARKGVTDLTRGIDTMRVSRDCKLVDIEKFNAEYQEWNQKLLILRQEKTMLEGQNQLMNTDYDDSFHSTEFQHKNKKANIIKLNDELEKQKTEIADKQSEVSTIVSELKNVNDRLNKIQEQHDALQATLKQKQEEWIAMKKAAMDEEELRQHEEMERQQAEQQRLREAELQPQPKDNIFGSELSWGTGLDWSKTSTSSPDWSKSSASDWSKNNTSDWAKSSTPEISVTADTGTKSYNGFHNTYATKRPVAKTGGVLDLFGVSKANKSKPASDESRAGCTKYRALYEFEARNHDELDLRPGDFVWVRSDQTGSEPGWLMGERDGMQGCFPEAYVEAVSGDTPATGDSSKSSVFAADAALDAWPAQEPVKEEVAAQQSSTLLASESSSFTAVMASSSSPLPGGGEKVADGVQAQAVYPWRAKKENHLTFNKGDIITVLEQQDMWWSGEIDGKVGWFPKSYVKIIGGSEGDVEQPAATEPYFPSDEMPLESASDDGEYYVAIYTYTSNEPADLVFNQGEVICVTKKDGDWWTGSIGDRTGMFPGNYVQLMETNSQTPPQSQSRGSVHGTPGTPKTLSLPGQKINKKPEIATVIAQYTATGPEQLSLNPGQLISVRKRSDSGWWEGELQARGQKRRIGWFPANYVKMLGSSTRTTPVAGSESCSLSISPNHKSDSVSPMPSNSGSRTDTPVQPTTAPALEQVVALYSYSAQNKDELTFHKNSIINVLGKDDADWWKGEVNGVTGMFPSNYVQPLSEANPAGGDA